MSKIQYKYIVRFDSGEYLKNTYSYHNSNPRTDQIILAKMFSSINYAANYSRGEDWIRATSSRETRNCKILRVAIENNTVIICNDDFHYYKYTAKFEYYRKENTSFWGQPPVYKEVRREMTTDYFFPNNENNESIIFNKISNNRNQVKILSVEIEDLIFHGDL